VVTNPFGIGDSLSGSRSATHTESVLRAPRITNERPRSDCCKELESNDLKGLRQISEH
jgi:hypothetical protein